MKKITIPIIAIVGIFLLSSVNSVYAQSVIASNNNSADTNLSAVTTDGRYWIMSAQDAGNIKAYDSNYNFLGTITCTNNFCNSGFYYHPDTGRLYYIAGTSLNTLYEIDATGYFNSRSVSLTVSHNVIFRYNSTMLITTSTTTTPTVDRVNLNTFVKTTGSSYAGTCNTRLDLLYANTQSTNKAVFVCNAGGTLKLAFMSNINTAFTAGAFDGSTSISMTSYGNNGMLDYTNNVFYYIKNPTLTSATINKITWNGTAWTNDTVIYQDGGKISGVSYSDYTNNKMYVVTASKTLVIINISTGAVSNYSFSSSVPAIPNVAPSAVPFLYSSGTRLVIATGTHYWLDFSLSGTIPSSNTGGVDCTQSNNANVLICRLVSQTGGSVGGVGGIIDTGIFRTLVNAGVLSGNDTNPKTNGVGYLMVVMGFGIMTAMFFIASKGNISEIPTYVWFISSLALLGSLTAIGWIDPTFLIIGIIAVIALAVAKMNKTLFSGASFAGGGFSGE